MRLNVKCSIVINVNIRLIEKQNWKDIEERKKGKYCQIVSNHIFNLVCIPVSSSLIKTSLV